jgi:hypothetical protein
MSQESEAGPLNLDNGDLSIHSDKRNFRTKKPRERSVTWRLKLLGMIRGLFGALNVMGRFNARASLQTLA